MTGLLEGIDSPLLLKNLRPEQLRPLADELRQCLLDSVSRTGGHLSANLGTVELTIALHYVFNTPEDRLVWDVGHQAYAHKILTGRRQRMSSIRQWGGLSGFPRREESPFDAFGTGHSSTSVSAALGMALAAKQQGIPRKTVAVIGDGALPSGVVFEAMNNAAELKKDLLVILVANRQLSRPLAVNYDSRAKIPEPGLPKQRNPKGSLRISRRNASIVRMPSGMRL